MNTKKRSLLAILFTMFISLIMGCSDDTAGSNTSNPVDNATLELVPKTVVMQNSSAEVLEAPPVPPTN